MLSVSEDGRASITLVGVMGSSFVDYGWNVRVQDDGAVIFMVNHDASGDTIFRQAIRVKARKSETIFFRRGREYEETD